MKAHLYYPQNCQDPESSMNSEPSTPDSELGLVVEKYKFGSTFSSKDALAVSTNSQTVGSSENPQSANTGDEPTTEDLRCLSRVAGPISPSIYAIALLNLFEAASLSGTVIVRACLHVLKHT